MGDLGVLKSRVGGLLQLSGNWAAGHMSFWHGSWAESYKWPITDLQAFPPITPHPTAPLQMS